MLYLYFTYTLINTYHIVSCFSPPVVSLSDVTAIITSPSVTSPLSTAAKTTIVASIKTTTASSEPDVAFPAVLKGSQKQRVPPPVPPRGSPKAQRGGGNSQSSSIDTKGELTQKSLEISVNDIPIQTPLASSDEDFIFYTHGFKTFKNSSHLDVACHLPLSVSDRSVKIEKLLESNSFLDFVEDGDSITERSHPGKNLIAQTTMMAKFNVNRTIREHLDSGDYEDPSLTESSSEERIVIHQVIDGNNMRKMTKSPLVCTPGDENSLSQLDFSTKRLSAHNVSSSDLINAAKSLKKTSTESSISSKAGVSANGMKSEQKPSIISGITKRISIRRSKKEKDRNAERKDVKSNPSKAKVEIKTYTEKHLKGMSKDEVICHRKAKSKIDLFQKHIMKVQSDSENSSLRSSKSSIADGKRPSLLNVKSNQVERRHSDVVKETKKIFEPIEYTHGSQSSIEKKSNFTLNTTTLNPVLSKAIKGNVHEKIKKFSNVNSTEISKKKETPNKVPRQKKLHKKASPKTKFFFKVRKDIEEIL